MTKEIESPSSDGTGLAARVLSNLAAPRKLRRTAEQGLSQPNRLDDWEAARADSVPPSQVLPVAPPEPPNQCSLLGKRSATSQQAPAIDISIGEAGLKPLRDEMTTFERRMRHVEELQQSMAHTITWMERAGPARGPEQNIVAEAQIADCRSRLEELGTLVAELQAARESQHRRLETLEKNTVDRKKFEDLVAQVDRIEKSFAEVQQLRGDIRAGAQVILGTATAARLQPDQPSEASAALFPFTAFLRWLSATEERLDHVLQTFHRKDNNEPFKGFMASSFSKGIKIWKDAEPTNADARLAATTFTSGRDVHKQLRAHFGQALKTVEYAEHRSYGSDNRASVYILDVPDLRAYLRQISGADSQAAPATLAAELNKDEGE